MACIHFCLLCHTEGPADAITRGVAAMLALREKVERQTGKRLPVTWTLGTYHNRDPERKHPAVFETHEKLFKKLHERGDEIGLHPHGIPDQNNIMKVDPFIRGDTQALIAAGFPRPKTIVVGTWSLYPSTLRIIEQAGYCVDSSVAGGKLVQNGVVIYDYPVDYTLHPIWRRPYRPARDNVMRAGNSAVVEIPASGHLLEFAKGEDEELVWEFFEHHISKRFKLRWQHRHEQAVDVFEVFWHPFEVLDSRSYGKSNGPLLRRFEEFLSSISTWEGVVFSTLYDAAMDWERI